MNEVHLKTLQYILEKSKNTFDKDVIIERDENESFGLIIFSLASQGYLNSFSFIDKGVINGFEISQIIVNISRNSEPFIKGSTFLD